MKRKKHLKMRNKHKQHLRAKLGANVALRLRESAPSLARC